MHVIILGKYKFSYDDDDDDDDVDDDDDENDDNDDNINTVLCLRCLFYVISTNYMSIYKLWTRLFSFIFAHLSEDFERFSLIRRYDNNINIQDLCSAIYNTK